MHLLGTFQVSIGTRSIADRAWRARKAAALIKLLALAPHHRLHREQLVEFLWPELDPTAAGNNLYYTLHVARRLLQGEPAVPLQLQADHVSLGTPTSVWTDVEAFETALSIARRSNDPAACRAALELYGGDLLPADRYEDWAAARRETLRGEYLSLLLRYAQLLQECGEMGAAGEALERALTADPLLEEAHAGLMRLYAQSGQRQRALRQFERLQQVLKRELEAEPDDDTRRLYEDILAGRFAPPPRDASVTPESHLHNLPTSLTNFIGRKAAVDEVCDRLSRCRALTLTGAGGTGKTRLALESARHMIAACPDGVWMVELAPLSHDRQVASTVAHTLSIDDVTDRSSLAVLVEALAHKQMLLLLDNCEHLIEATARLAATVLDSCPGIRILATSREPLAIPGEVVWTVPPLALPPGTATPSSKELHESEAVQLFVTRAGARQPGFALTAANEVHVATICRRLDGLPLAIELAAARIGALSPEQIAARLENALTLLTSGSRTAEPRRRTLRGALDWSYDLLDESERTLLRHCAVFVGGWTLESAESIGTELQAAGHSVLDLISRLVDKSLVVAEPTIHGSIRYTLLEPIRQYALDLLERDPLQESLRRRHATLFVELAEQAQAQLSGPDQVLWFDRLEEEHDNLRAALRYAVNTGDAVTGLRFAGSLWRFWAVRGYTNDGRRLQQEVLSLPQASTTDPDIRALALNGAGALSYYQGNYADATNMYQSALALRRQMGDTAAISRVLSNLGLVAKEQGAYEQAISLYEESLQLAREVGNTLSQAAALNNLGILIQDQGNYERATALHEESLSLMRQLGDLHGIVNSLNNLSAIALERRDHARTNEYGIQALAMAREIGARRSIGVALINLGRAAHELGDFESATTRLRDATDTLESTGDTELVASCLEEWAALACAQNRYRRAATLFGAAAAGRQASGSQLNPQEHARFEAIIATARHALPPYTFEAAFLRGEVMKPSDALAFALTPEDSDPCPPRIPLTRRETEIARLLGDGLTNRQIAGRLGIAERTVDTHVERVLKKLGVSSRTQVAAYIGTLSSE